MRTASSSLAALALIAGCAQEYEVIQGPVDVDPGDVAECGFSPISGTKLSVYDCNPVFSGGAADWGFISTGFRTQEVLGHPFYQIWYTTAPPGTSEWRLGYAASASGTAWEDHEANPLARSQAGAWDQDGMDGVQVLWDSDRGEYVLWYQGFRYGDGLLDAGDWGIGIKTSPDGVAWTNLRDDGMVIDLARPVAGVDYCWPLGANWSHNQGYSGYLAGGPPEALGQFPVCQVYRFTGQSLDDPSSFNFESDPILEAGPEPYDRSGMASVAVVEWAPDEHYLFYVGFRDWVDQGTFISSDKPSLNLATSTDGQNWEKSPENPLPVNLANPARVRDVAAQKYGSRILLWVTDYYEELDQMAVGFYLFEPNVDPHP